VSKRVVYLTDEQWRKIEPFIPRKSRGERGGRPRADDRLVFEGILWILKTGARWRDLPDRYPHPSTCWRRLREWYEDDVLKDMWRAFLSELDHDGILDWDEVFVDASFFPAKKGARQLGLPSGERERSAWYWSMARVFLSEAIPTLPRRLRSRSGIKALGEIRVPRQGPGRPRTRPKRVIGDKAYDSDPARKRLRQRGTNLLLLIERIIVMPIDRMTDSGIAPGDDI
jgi:transposase